MSMVLSTNERVARLEHAATMLKSIINKHKNTASIERTLINQGEYQAIIKARIEALNLEDQDACDELRNYLNALTWVWQPVVTPGKPTGLTGIQWSSTSTFTAVGDLTAFDSFQNNDIIYISGSEVNSGSNNGFHTVSGTPTSGVVTVSGTPFYATGTPTETAVVVTLHDT